MIFQVRDSFELIAKFLHYTGQPKKEKGEGIPQLTVCTYFTRTDYNSNASERWELRTVRSFLYETHV